MKTPWSKLLVLSVLALLVWQAGAATFYVNVNNASPVSPFTGWDTAATNIQDAIDASTDGDLILVTNGVYATGGQVVYGSLTNRVVINKAVTVQSVNGPAVTTICGYQVPSGSTAFTNDVRCVYMTNNAVLDGFTITNGSTLAASANSTNVLCGGGVYCESTNATLTNCILTGNFCQSQLHGKTGGAAVFQGILYSCILSNNLVGTNSSNYQVYGGGAYQSVLNNCTIVSNSASFGGGAAYSILNNCKVVGNNAPNYGSTSWGGGTYYCIGYHCLISGNYSATWGGGDYNGILNFCTLSNNLAGGRGSPWTGFGGGGALGAMSYNNCLVVSNYSSGNGGGVFVDANLILTNCTIIGNTALSSSPSSYGGVSGGKLLNSIVYGNSRVYSSVTYLANASGSTLTNCWTNNPVFLNAGKNTYVVWTNDLDGNPRIVGGTVDIGAYEYQSPSSILSYAWAQQYGLPTDGSADYADTDGDQVSNYAEWKSGTIPTNAASVLQLASPVFTNSPAGMVVTWQSVSGISYYLQRSSDLAQPFSVLQSNLVGKVGTTIYKDTSATNSGPYFYRVGVQ
jgi:hypothetical protein